MTRDKFKILVLTLLVTQITVSVVGAVIEPIGFTAGDWIKYSGDLYKAGNYTEALMAINKAIEIDSHDATAWYDQGQIYLAEHKYNDALIAFEKSLIIKPNGANAWNGKGVALTELDRYDEAQLAYDESLRLDPTYLSARENQMALENKMRNEKTNPMSSIDSEYIVDLSNNSTETMADSFGKAMENNTTEVNVTNNSAVNTSSEITKLNATDYGITSKKVETATHTIENNMSNQTNVAVNTTNESKHWWEFWK